MDSVSLKKQLNILRDRAQFSIPLGFDGIIILVTELIAMKISFGDSWSGITKSNANLEDLVKQANYLQDALHINTIEVNRASKHMEMPEWLRQLLIFVDGIKIDESNRKELAFILIELLGENSREYFSFTKGLRVFLCNLANTYDKSNVLSVGSSAACVLMGLTEAQHRKLLVQSGDDLIRLLFYIAGEESDISAGTLLIDSVHADVDRGAPYSSAIFSLPWNLKAYRHNEKNMLFARYPINPSSPESLHIQAALELVKGKSVFVLPPSFLFKTAGADLQLKQYLVERNLIDAVIQLPESIMHNTMISPVVLVLNDNKQTEEIYIADYSGSVAFGNRWRNDIDESVLCTLAKNINQGEQSESSRYIHKHEIEENDYNLSVQRYILSGNENRIEQILSSAVTVSLSEIADIRRAQTVRTSRTDEDEIIAVKIFKEVMPADIGCNGSIFMPKKDIEVDEVMIDRAERQSLEPGDILLAIKGSVGKVGIVASGCGDNWIAGQSFVIIRLKKNAPINNPVILYRYLASELAQSLIASRVVGAGVKMIKMKDVENLTVIVPSIDEQEAIINNNNEVADRCQQIKDIKRQIDERLEAFWAL